MALTVTGDRDVDALLESIAEGTREAMKQARSTSRGRPDAELPLRGTLLDILRECDDAVWNWG